MPFIEEPRPGREDGMSRQKYLYVGIPLLPLLHHNSINVAACPGAIGAEMAGNI